jgi:hypothetical protein
LYEFKTIYPDREIRNALISIVKRKRFGADFWPKALAATRASAPDKTTNADGTRREKVSESCGEQLPAAYRGVAYDQPLHGAVYIKGRRAADLDMALVWYLGRGARTSKGFATPSSRKCPKTGRT